jgi:hypothetical protein
MNPAERTIIKAVLRYNGIPENDMAAHIEMSCTEGTTRLDRAAYLNYKIIWNSFTKAQKYALTFSRVPH